MDKHSCRFSSPAGGQQAVREREHEVGFQEKAFWQWDLQQEAYATGTQTTGKFLVCFWVSNQQKLFLGREWKWSTWHSEEAPHPGKWMPLEICTPYLCSPAFRENPVSCTSATSGFDNFWILFDPFLMPWTKYPWLCSGKERAQPGCYVGNQLGHKWDLYFAFSLCLRSGSIFTINCPAVLSLYLSLSSFLFFFLFYLLQSWSFLFWKNYSDWRVCLQNSSCRI